MKKIAGLMLLIILLFFNSEQFLAYNTLNDHVINGGVGDYGYTNRYYFITSSAAGYASEIKSAMNDWIYTTQRLGITTPISYKQTTSQKSSVMDIYACYSSNYPYCNANAWTEFWRYQNGVSPFYQNWGWNKIYLNSYNMNNKTSILKKGVIAHEMGHCFGLNENNTNPFSIMCQSGYGRRVTAAQADDLYGINYLY